MKALTYIEHNHFALLDKPEPEIIDPRDAVVRVTLGSYLHQRPAHQARLRTPCRARYHRRPRDGGHGGSRRCSGHKPCAPATG